MASIDPDIGQAIKEAETALIAYRWIEDHHPCPLNRLKIKHQSRLLADLVTLHETEIHALEHAA